MGRQAQRAQPMNLADIGWAAQTAPRSDEFTTPRFSAARPSSLARPRPKKCHIVQPFSRSNSLKTKKTCAKEVSQNFEACALSSPRGKFPAQLATNYVGHCPTQFHPQLVENKTRRHTSSGTLFRLALASILASLLACLSASRSPRLANLSRSLYNQLLNEVRPLQGKFFQPSAPRWAFVFMGSGLVRDLNHG